MATSELVSPRRPLSGRPGTEASASARVWDGLPALIGVLILATVAYAAFAHGAVTRATATRVELIVAAVSAVAALGWLWRGTVSLSAVRATLIGVILLGAFAFWSGLSVLWSISPDQTWIEVNRVVTYTLVAGLGVAVGASHARGVELIAKGFLLAALAVTVYALGQKILPGLHLAGVFDLNQTGPVPRLQEPLGYWNALALFIGMGTPAALALAADRARSAAARLGAACGLALMLITVPFTYSRGGLVALAVALATGIAASRQRLRCGVWLLAAVLCSLPAILVGLLMHQLSAADVPLGTREWAGGVLAASLVGGLLALGFAARWITAREARLRLSANGARRLRRITAAVVAALVVAGLVALTASHRGFTGEVSHLWHGFTSPHTTNNYNPQRLLSTDSYRWLWWKEAATAFGARPWQGWGAGSFPALHLLYRRNTLSVQQPHNVPLQFLAETGVMGALLGIGAFVLLVSGAVRAVRARPAGSERLLAAALLGGALAYGIHCLYDWDWNFPALTVPALLFLGVISGARARQPGGWVRTGAGLRAVALAGMSVFLCILALSVELPELAADKAGAALVQAASTSPAALRAAQADAWLASRLDPVSDAGLLTEATIALHDSRPEAARIYSQQAVARDPGDPEAWRVLASVDHRLADPVGAFRALQRAIELDPMGRDAQTAVARLLHNALPSSSATRFPTPPG